MAYSADYFKDRTIDEGKNRAEADDEALTERENTEMHEGEMAEKELEDFSIIFPPEILHHIFSFLEFNDLNKMRLVSRQWNDICKHLLIKKLNIFRAKVKRYLLANQKRLQKLTRQRYRIPFIKQEVVEIILTCLKVLSNFLKFPNYCDKKWSFDAGKVVQDAVHLFNRLKSSEELPYSFEEIIPHSFILFEKVQQLRSSCDIPFEFDNLKNWLLIRYLRKQQTCWLVPLNIM